MKTMIAIILLFAVPVFAGDSAVLDGLDAHSSITKEQIKSLFDETGSPHFGPATISTCYYIWEPKEDITTYELALCLSVLLDRQIVENLPKKAARHFREVCQ